MRLDETHESEPTIEPRGGRSPLRFLRGPGGVVAGLLVVGVAIVGGVLGMHRHDDEPGITETTSASLHGDHAKELAGVVLDDAQETWRSLFARNGKHYESAQIVLYRDQTTSSCGFGPAATGPFFCPSDDRVYVDVGFDDDVANRLGGGDPAEAYVLAHEIGHHVQKLLGATAMIKSFRRDQREGEEGANVRLELQADCYAGVWAHATERHGLLDSANIASAMNAAAAVGHARLERMAAGHVSPETFTYGTADQRLRWFNAGFAGGEVEACDTFSASGL